MLELKNISYIVNEDGKEKAILKDINLTVDEHFVAITGLTVAVNQHLRRS